MTLPMTRYLGIREKTALIFFIVFVLIMLPVNMIIYKNVKQILIDSDTRELSLETERLFSQVRVDPPGLPLPPLGYTMYARIISNVRTDSLFASPNFPTALPTDSGETIVYDDTLKIITRSRPLPYSQAEVFFSLGRSQVALMNQLRQLQFYLIGAGGLSILIAGALVFFASGYTLRPIRKIISVAQHVNASKSIERVPVPSTPDEIQQLALTVNEMLARIENSIQSQTNFFASAAHELRTPLTVMKAELTAVTDTHRWHAMLKEVERLERIVNDFLMVSQLQAETIAIRKRPTDVQEWVVGAVKKVKYLCEETHAKIQIRLPENGAPIAVNFDEEKMEVVLVNLLENALKYASPNPTVVIELTLTQHLSLSVSNPIDRAISDPSGLIQEFVKLDAMSSGLGLGLWIVNKIVSLHEGNLRLDAHNGFFVASISVPL